MRQKTLFEVPIARNSDKQTSHEAAAEIKPKMGILQAEFLRRLGRLAEATANEVAAGDESIRKRALELVRSGMIEEVGTRECKRTGKRATVYCIEGRA